MSLLRKMILPLLAVVLLTGCVEYDVKVKVNQDGSGTIHEKVVFGKGMMNMLNAFAAWGGDDADLDLYDKRELKKQARSFGKGVKYVKSKRITDNGREGYYAVYDFNDVTRLRIDQDPENKMPSSFASDDNDRDDGPITFDFKEGNYSTLYINIPGEFDPEDFDMDMDDDDMDTDELEEFEGMLRDLSVNITVEVDGYIEKTNASFYDDSEITLIHFDMDQIMDDPDQFDYLKNYHPDTKEDVIELMDDFPGLQMELENKVKVVFN